MTQNAHKRTETHTETQ